jgi:hypothetical protein
MSQTSISDDVSRSISTPQTDVGDINSILANYMRVGALRTCVLDQWKYRDSNPRIADGGPLCITSTLVKFPSLRYIRKAQAVRRNMKSIPFSNVHPSSSGKNMSYMSPSCTNEFEAKSNTL